MKKSIGIIPARYGSTRFPGKPLVDILGKPMIQWTYENAKKASSLDEVYVATDDDRIRKVVADFGGKALMTSPNHQSGTDRCMEAIAKLDFSPEIIINIQGDEPLIKAKMIDQLYQVISRKSVQLATLIQKIEKQETLFDPNRVKVVTDKYGKALLFSRAAIPFLKDYPEKEWLTQYNYYKHIGIYAYKIDTLKSITKLAISSLEKTESLEQLRWLENGYEIYTGITQEISPSVDTQEDLVAIVNQIKKQ